MTSKLTLALDSEVVKKAKKYAQQRYISLSKLVESFFSSLTSETGGKQIAISPITSGLAGIVKFTDIKDKDIIANELIRKYL